MRILGINAVFHDPAAALVVDGRTVAAAEEERFTRRKHGKRPVPFATWELPERAAAWCLEQAGLGAGDLDAVAYSYDPARCRPAQSLGLDDPWDHLRITFAEQAPGFVAAALPGVAESTVRFVPHHVAHAASAGLASPLGDSSVLVCDGRGEAASHLAGRYAGGSLEVLASQALPHSLGLFYEQATSHLGFRSASDEYKVMALASYGRPRFAAELAGLVYPDGSGGFRTEPVEWGSLVKRRAAGGPLGAGHADLAASVQRVLQDVLLDLIRWLHGRTGDRFLAMAGGVALNCVANSYLAADGPFERIWVQPAAGDAGTALGGALALAAQAGDAVSPMHDAYLGRGWTDDELAAWLDSAAWPYERPASIAEAVATELASDRIVAWFAGRSEYGPRALGGRSLLAHPGRRANLDRLNAVKGREEFRPVAPMVLADRAAEIFRGPLPSPYMLFVHEVDSAWRERIPAVVHVDGTARVQTVDRHEQPVLAELLDAFAARTGLPVVVNTSLNTAGRPMVDDPRDALECFGSAPVDVLALGPFLIRRPGIGMRRALSATGSVAPQPPGRTPQRLPARLRHDAAPGAVAVSRRRGHAFRSQRGPRPSAREEGQEMKAAGPRTLAAIRPDGMGDVLLTGPAVRAMSRSGRVAFLAGPAGAAAAALLPGVHRVVRCAIPWIDPDPGPAGTRTLARVIGSMKALRTDEAVIFTSFHQSPLPMALVLRLAGVQRISAISDDYPGSLLDVRHRVTGDMPEAERNLSLALAAGFRLPAGDDGRLAVRGPLPDATHLTGAGRYVVVHPGASVPARRPSAAALGSIVAGLAAAGHPVVLTGTAAERPLATRVRRCGEAAGPGLVADLSGRTSLAALASVLAGADVVVAPNTGAAHLAAAVGTPVVSLFAPVVPAARWAPFGVPSVVLGDQGAPCAGTRARRCPVPGHPCLDTIDPGEVVAAVAALRETPRTGQRPAEVLP